jgi:hypothetical protein
MPGRTDLSYRFILSAPFLMGYLDEMLGPDRPPPVETAGAWRFDSSANASQSGTAQDLLLLHAWLLKPYGFIGWARDTADSCSAETWHKIEPIGGVKEGKKGFSKGGQIQVICINNEKALSDIDADLPTIKFYIKPDSCVREEENPKWRVQNFSVPAPRTKVAGCGIAAYLSVISNAPYHVLVLHQKKINLAKTPDIERIISKIKSARDCLILRSWHAALKDLGHDVWINATGIVNRVQALSPHVAVPVFIEELWEPDTGSHQPCTAYGAIIKMARQHPQETNALLAQALKAGHIPVPYQDVIVKASKFGSNSLKQKTA